MTLTIKGYKVHLVDDSFERQKLLSNQIYIDKHTLTRQSCLGVECTECPFSVKNSKGVHLGCTLKGIKYSYTLTKEILKTAAILKPRNVK